MSANEYLIGSGINGDKKSIWIGYRPRQGASEAVIAQVGTGPHATEKCLSPQKILEFKYKLVTWDEKQSERRDLKISEEKDWFEHRCREADCEWFVPMVKRMAAGENVPLEEIQAAYLAHNGKPMPCGEWAKIFV